MNKYRKKYIEENGMKTFNNYNVNDYTEFLENELEAITVTHCCKSDSEQLCECKDKDIKHIDNFSDRMVCKCGKRY